MNEASPMTRGDVRQVLLASESLLRAGDPYGASARAKEAADAAVVAESPEGTALRQEVVLAVARFEAAQAAALEETRERQALHVANERRAAGIPTATLEPRAPSRARRITDLIGRALERCWIGLTRRQPAR